MTANAAPTAVTATFALCKAFVAAPARSALRELLRDFQISQYADGRPGRGSFGMYANQVASQFASYLALDASRATVQPAIGILPPVSPEERHLLASVHREVAALNAAAIAPIAAWRAHVAPFCDPYFGIAPESLQDNATGPTAVPAFLDANLAAAVAAAFAQSSLVQGVLSTPAAIADAYEPAVLAEAVRHFDHVLRRPGAGGDTSTWTLLAFNTPRDRPDRLAVAYHVGLASVRAALRCLDQLLFQAATSDRITAIDQDHLIHVNGPRSDAAEHAVEIVIQPSSEVRTLKPGHVVLLTHPHRPHLDKLLCEVVSARFRHTEDTGATEEYFLHILDDCLNPYPLAAHLQH